MDLSKKSAQVNARGNRVFNIVESREVMCQGRREVGPVGLLTPSKKVLANRPA